jgi:hypothetical protein
MAVLFENNSIGASVRMTCDLLGVDHRDQIRKIRADRAIHDSLVLAIVETEGGPQETNVIIAEAIPLWLKGIHPSKVAPEARETLEEFRNVAVETLRAFFFPETREQPRQSAPPKLEPEAQPLPPPKAEPAAQPLPPPPPRPPETDEFAYWEPMVGGFTGLEVHIREMVALLKQTRAEQAQMAQQLAQQTQALQALQETLLQQKVALTQQGRVQREQHELLHEHSELLRQHSESLRWLEEGQRRLAEEQRRLKTAASVREPSYLEEELWRVKEGLREQDVLRRQLADLLGRLSAQVRELAAVVAPPEKDHALAAEHVGELRGLMQAAAHQTGQQASVIEQELAAAFGVETLSQLSEAAWSELVAWLHERLGW